MWMKKLVSQFLDQENSHKYTIKLQSTIEVAFCPLKHGFAEIARSKCSKCCWTTCVSCLCQQWSPSFWWPCPSMRAEGLSGVLRESWSPDPLWDGPRSAGLHPLAQGKRRASHSFLNTQGQVLPTSNSSLAPLWNGRAHTSVPRSLQFAREYQWVGWNM